MSNTAPNSFTLATSNHRNEQTFFMKSSSTRRNFNFSVEFSFVSCWICWLTHKHKRQDVTVMSAQ